MPDHDVVIVGAGPVGMLLACLLAQDGVDVAVCEQRTGVDERSRAIGIHPPGLAALDAAGLGEAVRAEALALHGGDVHSRGRLLASVDFPEERPVRILPQHRTDALLRGRLEDLGSSIVHRGCRVAGVRDDGELLRISVEEQGEERELTASLLVAADGVRSSIRTALGVRWRRRPGSASYAMLDAPDAEASRRAHLYCEPAGLVESFPLPGGRRRWVVRERTPLRSAAAFAQAIEERTGIRPEIPPDARPAAFKAEQHLADRVVVGRVALLGDAAHEISPIGGQGMNLGWMDAQRIAAAITGRREVRRVERGIRRSAQAAQLRSRFYMAMGSPARRMPLLARETMIRALGIPSGFAAGLVTMRGL